MKQRLDALVARITKFLPGDVDECTGFCTSPDINQIQCPVFFKKDSPDLSSCKSKKPLSLLQKIVGSITVSDSMG